MELLLKQTLCLILSNEVFIILIMSIQIAIEHFGSQAEMARILGVKPMVIYQWKKRRIPAERAKQIVTATKGLVSLEQLRPDLFEVKEAVS